MDVELFGKISLKYWDRAGGNLRRLSKYLVWPSMGPKRCSGESSLGVPYGLRVAIQVRWPIVREKAKYPRVKRGRTSTMSLIHIL